MNNKGVKFGLKYFSRFRKIIRKPQWQNFWRTL